VTGAVCHLIERAIHGHDGPPVMLALPAHDPRSRS
jgi:hypothetical protein